MAIAPDPTQLSILTYKAHSASKFDETDFIYLKALWRNRSVTEFHISQHVRAEYVSKAREFVGQRPGPSAEQGQQPVCSLRQSMITFINTVAAPFRPNDPVNVQLGAFLVTSWLLEQTKSVNNQGQHVGGDTIKIVRRSARLKQQKEARAAADREREGASLNQQIEGLTINPRTIPPAPETPASRVIGTTAAMADTHELDVLSPESMGLEMVRSEDEEIVNSALVNLLAAITLCSGIMSMKGREGLQWLPKRQAFSLGSANNTVCEARTDGVLRNPGSLDCRGPLAILEVKPYKRNWSQAKIEWQEACQMAAWISTSLRESTAERRRAGSLSTSDNTKRRRILISQDYRFLYITVGEWGKGYETHLSGGGPRPVTPPSKNSSPIQNRGLADAKPATTPPNPPPPANLDQTAGPRNATPEDLNDGNFSIMNCYGAYSLDEPQHVRLLIRNVLALMLELSDPWD
ncbi:hypothetical protein BT67DRAFT_449992 [Trichocladium antarcticum]|uniref:Uncharacterized protein n=1 Tax=Trichocladium antarcticum TaxID=1450529 RepID=A0AAN6UJC5_9PEZI|nr:hypothetical protein BT67DRAFT_449992 [Trichocladium antarcticum]